jgi:AcrR family transcriptional regulator
VELFEHQIDAVNSLCGIRFVHCAVYIDGATMPRLTDPEQTILTSAYRLFYRHGFNRVSMDEIAAAARVTKRTLYYHFRSKDDLIAAALERQHEIALSTFRAWTDRIRGKPETMVAMIFNELQKWVSQRDFFGSGFTRVAIELAEMPGHPARAIARRHKAMVEGVFAELLLKGGVPSARRRARQIYTLMEGATALMLVHGDKNYISAAAEAGKAIVHIRRSRPQLDA